MPEHERKSNRITIGATAGHHFHGNADLQLAKHCHRGAQHGYFMTRKRLVNRAAFNYDPTLGWEVDRWFEWDETEAAKAAKGEVMSDEKTRVMVRLDARQMALLEKWRQDIKARSGKLCTRAVAIASLISAFGDFQEAAQAAKD